MRLRRRVRPVLLLLVFSGFLLIVGTTASGQALFVSEDTQQALLESAAGSDTATVRSFVGLNLTPADLAPGRPGRRPARDCCARASPSWSTGAASSMPR